MTPPTCDGRTAPDPCGDAEGWNETDLDRTIGRILRGDAGPAIPSDFVRRIVRRVEMERHSTRAGWFETAFPVLLAVAFGVTWLGGRWLGGYDPVAELLARSSAGDAAGWLLLLLSSLIAARVPWAAGRWPRTPRARG